MGVAAPPVRRALRCLSGSKHWNLPSFEAHRQHDLPPPSAAPSTMVPAYFVRSPPPTPITSCTWGATATHQVHPAVRAWLAPLRGPPCPVTPTSGCWLNLVEAFFSILTRQALPAATSPPLPASSPPSSASSPPGTTAAGRSPGPRSPTPSSAKPPTRGAGRHNRRQIRSTRDRPDSRRTRPRLQ